MTDNFDLTDNFDFAGTGETFTYDDLVAYCDKEWQEMSDNEKYMSLMYCDPTFHQYVLSNLKKGETVRICEPNKDFEIIKK